MSRPRRSPHSAFWIGQDVAMVSNPAMLGHVVGFDPDGSVMVHWSDGGAVSGVSPSNLRGLPPGHAGRRSTAENRRRTVVADFSTLPELIEHAKTTDGATHILIRGQQVQLFFPLDNGRYDVATVWQDRGYWHAPAKSARTVVTRLPEGAEPIGSHTRRASQRASERVVRDFATPPEIIEHARIEGATHVVVNTAGNLAWLYFPVDSGKYAEARVRHDRGYWHSEAPGDREVLDRIPRGAELIEAYLERSGGRGGPTRGRQPRQPVRTAEAPATRSKRKSGRPTMTQEAVMQLAAELAQQLHGSQPKEIPGGFRWSEQNEAAQFTTFSPEYRQKVVCVVSTFEDGSIAVGYFSDEGLSETNRYENIGHNTYQDVDLTEMVKDIQWVWETVDEYAASWQEEEEGNPLEEARRPPRSTPAKQEWMRTFQDEAVAFGAHPGQIKWQDAEYLYRQGWTAKAAARNVYGLAVDEAKAPRFADVRDMLLDGLKQRGWTVVAGLKVPHATSADGQTRLWFKTQAVYMNDPGTDPRQFSSAHSLSMDMREYKSVDDLLADIARRQRPISEARRPARRTRSHR